MYVNRKHPDLDGGAALSAAAAPAAELATTAAMDGRFDPRAYRYVEDAIAAAALPDYAVNQVEEAPEFDEAFLASGEAIGEGETLWAAQCRHCHGSSAYPGKAPKLTPASYTPDYVFDRVTNGFKKMPAWKSVFTLDERVGIVAYVLSEEFSP